MNTTRSHRAALAAASLVLTTISLAGCGGGGTSGGTRNAVSTGNATAATSIPEVIERWMAYLADEATSNQAGALGTDLNGNGVTNDSVASAVNMATGTERVLGVSANQIHMVRTQANGTHLFTVTDEAKDVNWDLDPMLTSVVLLHTQLETATPMEFVATLGGTGTNPTVLTVDDRLYYVDSTVVPLAGETTVRFVDTTFQDTALTPPFAVANEDVTDSLSPQLLGTDEGLIFLGLDEVVEVDNDFNADGDFLDTTILGLLDGTDTSAEIFDVPASLQDATVPLRALNLGPGDWLVSFLVDEATSNYAGVAGTNMNVLTWVSPFTATGFPASWQPPQCVGLEDADELDQVLYYLQFAEFTADPVLAPIINTGLVGDDRLVTVSDGLGAPMLGYVATVSYEMDQGTCSLNGDPDQDDDILRWVGVPMPVVAGNQAAVVPYTNVANLDALDTMPIVGGGPMGATDLDGRFLNVVSELEDSRDHDGDPLVDNDVVGWLDPFDGGAAFWEFDQSNPAAPPIEPVATAWMGQRPERDRTPTGFKETYTGDLNGDGDDLDSMPTFGLFATVGGVLEMNFPGVPVAVAETNAGIDFSNGIAFYRVDEAADSRDWNNDGNMTDMVLFRTTVNTLQNSFYISTLNSLQGPAIYRAPSTPGPEVGVAFLADETMAGDDYNADGDSNDLVVRWFRVN